MSYFRSEEKRAINDLISCSICMEKYSDNRQCKLLINCPHYFCEICLDRLVGNNDETQVLCPSCRIPSDLNGCGIDGLRNNLAVHTIVEIFKVTALPIVFSNKVKIVYIFLVTLDCCK